MNAPAATNPILVLRQEIDASPEFARVLPAHISVDRFKRVLATAIMENPNLATCERRSVFNAALKCAQDGLLPDGREAVLVIYKDKDRGPIAQYQKMIAGIYKLLRNSGEIDGIQSHVVYEADFFDYELGDNPHIAHKPARGLRGKPIGVYAIARLKDGYTDREFMSVEQVERVRAKSRYPNSLGWSQFWEEMARKTVVRRLAKRLPTSTDREYLRDDDDGEDIQQSQEREPKPERIAFQPKEMLAPSFDSDELDQGELASAPGNPAAKLVAGTDAAPESAPRRMEPAGATPAPPPTDDTIHTDDPFASADNDPYEAPENVRSPSEKACAAMMNAIDGLVTAKQPDAAFVQWWRSNKPDIAALNEGDAASLRAYFIAKRADRPKKEGQ